MSRSLELDKTENNWKIEREPVCWEKAELKSGNNQFGLFRAL